ncbi:T9SS type A sorting domain-containing protein [bacterium]|nr:T9SS type A sorting domain-containing protein [bacterium]
MRTIKLLFLILFVASLNQLQAAGELIEVNPAEISAEIPAGGEATTTLSISNIQERDAISWEASVNGNDNGFEWVYVNPEFGEDLGGGEAEDVVITLTAYDDEGWLDAGTYSATLYIACKNKDADQTVAIGITMTVIAEEEEDLSVRDQILELIRDVEALVEDDVLNNRQGRLLRYKLLLAIRRLDRGRECQAIRMLYVFNIHVRNYIRQGVLPDDVGQVLREEANSIIEQLGIGQLGNRRDNNAGDDPLVLKDLAYVPSEHFMSQAYPNPFNPETKIRFGLTESDHVTIRVFDMNGRLMTTLVNELRNSGEYTVTWNAQTAPAGCYLVQMYASGFNEVRRVILTK